MCKLSGRLAAYLYPRRVEFIDEIPLTTTGKVKRTVLRALESERARAAGSARADR